MTFPKEAPSAPESKGLEEAAEAYAERPDQWPHGSDAAVAFQEGVMWERKRLSRLAPTQTTEDLQAKAGIGWEVFKETHAPIGQGALYYKDNAQYWKMGAVWGLSQGREAGLREGRKIEEVAHCETAIEMVKYAKEVDALKAELSAAKDNLGDMLKIDIETRAQVTALQKRVERLAGALRDIMPFAKTNGATPGEVFRMCEKALRDQAQESQDA
jgi:hypothetical protein